MSAMAVATPTSSTASSAAGPGAILRLQALRAIRSGRLLLSALTSVAEPLLRALGVVLLLRRLHHTLDMWLEYQERVRLFGKDPDSHERVDCEVLYEPDPSAPIRADVVFIHGLNGSSRKTWQRGAGDSGEEDTCWPRDWLPLDCPGARVLALDYRTDPYLWRPVWVSKSCRQKTMRDRSQKMTAKLMEFGIGHRPIVWVAHSKGGLFVKQILVDAVDCCLELVRNTHGILFYSVPHHGSWLATLSIPWLLGQSVEILEVRKGCPEIEELHHKFLSLYDRGHMQAEIVSFVESLPTPLYFTYARIVDETTADLGLGRFYTVSTNHKDICKPPSRESILYQELTYLINRTH